MQTENKWVFIDLHHNWVQTFPTKDESLSFASRYMNDSVMTQAGDCILARITHVNVEIGDTTSTFVMNYIDDDVDWDDYD